MKSTNLRIGNYLQDGKSKEILIVKKLTSEEIVTDVIDRSKFPLEDGWFLEPIPLTKEWLKRLGFQWLDEKDPYCYDSEFDLRIYDDGQVVWKGVFLHDVEILSVHELQNLNYLLTKKELEI